MEERERQTRFAAGQILSIAAENASASIDKFSTWLMISIAAFFSLMITKIEPGTRLAGIGDQVMLGSRVFLASCTFGIAARYLAAVVAGTAATRVETAKNSAPDNLDLELFAAEIVRGYQWPVRWLVQRSMRKVLAGDFAHGGRICAKFAQWQGWLTMAQAILALCAVLIVLN